MPPLPILIVAHSAGGRAREREKACLAAELPLLAHLGLKGADFEMLPRMADLPLWAMLLLGPMGGLTIAVAGCWLFLRRFERLQDEMLAFFRQELQDAHSRYARLVEIWLNRLKR